MGKYFVLDNTFKPYTFDEMLKPFLLYKDAYENLENKYTDIADKTGTIRGLLTENDVKAMERLNNYNASLVNAQNSLMTDGLTPGLRKDLANLKSFYHSSIEPIATAYATRKEKQKELNAKKLNDPTLIVENDITEPGKASSLDNFLEDPNYSYGRVYSGSLITEQVKNEASRLTKELVDYGKDPNSQLDQYTKLWFEKHGVTSRDITEFISDVNNGKLPSESNPILGSIIESVLDSTGITDVYNNEGRVVKTGWGTKDQKDKAMYSAIQGLYSGIGETKLHTYQDYENIAALNSRKSKEKDNSPAPDIFGSRTRSILQGDKGINLNRMASLSNILKTNIPTKNGYNTILSPEYFGKTSTNPLKIYEEYLELQKNPNKLPQEYKPYVSPRTAYTRDVKTIQEDQIKAATQYIQDKYGVSKILSKEDVEALNQLGYTSNSNVADYLDMDSKVDAMEKKYTMYSVNLASTDIPSNTIIRDILYKADKDQVDGLLYEINEQTGDKGKPISARNIKKMLADNASIDDIYITPAFPGKLILEIRSGDKNTVNRIIAHPSFLSDEASNLLQTISKMQDIINNNFTSEDITDGLNKVYNSGINQTRGLTQSYVPTRSKTSSKI